MKDWNVIVTIYQQGFRRALRALQDVGPTDRSSYHNVLVMRVGTIPSHRSKTSSV